MKYSFNNNFRLDSLENPLVTVAELEAEPMLFNASYEFAIEHGGKLTRRILAAVPYYDKKPIGKNIIIDTRVHMLMPGMYPAIPGWHADNFPRRKDNGQPDLNSFDPEVEHFVCLLSSDSRGVSSTEFYTRFVELDVWESHVWQSVDQQMRELAVEKRQNPYAHSGRSFFVPDGLIIRFNQKSLHRATPACRPGWRLFFRLSYLDQKPKDLIRHQTQVYTTESQGW